MTTRSESAPAHPHGNMVAQTVDTILAAAASAGDTMSPMLGGPDGGKEAQSDLLSDDFNISEDSPTKETREPSKNRYRTPRSSLVQSDLRPSHADHPCLDPLHSRDPLYARI